jgi:hypothetical protein
MPRPTSTEGQYDEASDRRRSAWPAILLASPVGLLIAMIVFTELKTTAPAVIEAGAAGMASVSQPIARPEPLSVPAAIGGPALGAARPAPEPSRDGATVPAATLQALIADPAVRNFKGLSENAWDFEKPADIPGFGPYRGADERTAPGEFKLTADE